MASTFSGAPPGEGFHLHAVLLWASAFCFFASAQFHGLCGGFLASGEETTRQLSRTKMGTFEPPLLRRRGGSRGLAMDRRHVGGRWAADFFGRQRLVKFGLEQRQENASLSEWENFRTTTTMTVGFFQTGGDVPHQSQISADFKR